MKSDKYTNYIITFNDDNKRIDNVIRRFLPGIPLKGIFKAIRGGDIRVNEIKIKQNYKLIEGDTLSIYTPLLNHKKQQKDNNTNYKLDQSRILFEDKDLLLYNKKRGDLVHGEKDSLDKRVQSYLKNKTKDSLSFSPGPLHRLDRNTQGLMVFSVSLRGAREFTSMLKAREVRKFYLTIVDGNFTKKEVWRDKINRDEKRLISYKSENGKDAHSIFTPLLSKNNKTLALVEIKTGRTHQIRVHCSIHNRPLTGDIKYNPTSQHKEYFLSAIALSFSKNSAILKNENFILTINSKTDSMIFKFFSKDELNNLEYKIRELLTL